MEIQGPGGVSGPDRAEPQRVPVTGSDPSVDVRTVSDRVEISEEAKLLEKLSQIPDMRTERIDESRKLIESGEYETEERIRVAVERLLEELT